eukprot:752172-Hanusia_phi.AAC.1
MNGMSVRKERRGGGGGSRRQEDSKVMRGAHLLVCVSDGKMGRGGAIKKPRIRVSKSDNHKDIGQNGQNGVESCNAGYVESFSLSLTTILTALSSCSMQPVEATFFHHALLNRAMKSLKYQKWYTRWFGIGEEGENYGHSRLIHPFSPFTKGVTVLSSCLLLYSAVSSAFAAGFFWTADSCVKTPTLYFDAVVDSFFLFEILLNFFTGTFIHNEYVDDLRRVTRSYMKRSFVFDLITSIPASYVEVSRIHLPHVFSDTRPARDHQSLH